MNDAMDDEIAALYRNLALLAEKQPGFRDEYDACFAALRRLQERRATELREQFRSERSLDPDVLDAAIAHADDLLNKHDVTNLRELQAAGRDDEPVLASSGISRSAQRHAAVLRHGFNLQEMAQDLWGGAIQLLTDQGADVRPLLDAAAARIEAWRANDRRRSVSSDQPDQNRRSAVQPGSTKLVHTCSPWLKDKRTNADCPACRAQDTIACTCHDDWFPFDRREILRAMPHGMGGGLAHHASCRKTSV